MRFLSLPGNNEAKQTVTDASAEQNSLFYKKRKKRKQGRAVSASEIAGRGPGIAAILSECCFVAVNFINKKTLTKL